MAALGAAFAAGLAVDVWKDTSELPKDTTTIYEPAISAHGMFRKYHTCIIFGLGREEGGGGRLIVII